MKFRRRQLLVCLLVILTWLGGSSVAWGQEDDYRDLCHELKASGLEIVDSGVAYGVPFVEISIPRGSSITSICHRVPSFDNQFQRCRNRLAFFNALNPSYIKTRTPQPNSIEADTLKIPLDFRKVPDIFSGYDDSLASYDKYLLVDVGKGFLALYERGELRRVFPISAGRAGERTPLFDFKIEDKDENHWSSIYDAWMPWALHMKGAYYIHGGVLPGRADSAGCIRLPINDAEQLFKNVEVGTPGRIIDTPKVEQDIYPAPFCR
ncbi:MAG: L,D-transpeptidase [Deltaproteobacteria bacterium]|nr:L,D-transpeptidase [Deltaproteobacteria bacterium]